MKIKIIYLLTVFCLLSAIALATTSFINNTGGAAIATRDGNVSVGNVSQSLGKLHVSGGNVYQDATKTLSIVGSVTDSNRMKGAYDVVVSGKYAYVVANASGNFTIIDVSNPYAPTIVGSLNDTLPVGNVANDVIVSGRYVYITQANANRRISIIDISNASAPAVVSSTLTVPRGSISPYISGKYMYTVGTFADNFGVIDISNPSSPTLLSTLALSPATIVGGLYVSGKYAYATSSGALQIIDISNVSAPVVVGTLSNTKLDSSRRLAVSGRYAFTLTANTNTFNAIDIANISEPVIAGTFTDDRLNNSVGIHIAGKHAYITSSQNSSMSIIDISNASSPFIVNSISDSRLSDAKGIFVSGKYAYVAAGGNDSLNIIDISGIDSPSASIGSVETGSLSVTENANVANDLYVGSGLNVGPNGIFSQGPLAILSGIAGAAFSVISATGTSIFFVDSGGNVGINTSTPTSLLQVNGDTNVTGTLYATNCIGCVTANRISADVTEDAGNVVNISNMNFSAGFNQTWRFAFYLAVNSSAPKTDDMNFVIAAPPQSSCVYTLTGAFISDVDKGWQAGCDKILFYDISEANPDSVIVHGSVATGNFTGPVTLGFALKIGAEGPVITVLRGGWFKATRIS